jgi:hypothetical protein
MLKNILNVIEINDNYWSCVVFHFNEINVAGLYVTYDQFLEMEQDSFEPYNLRLYKKSQKAVVSGQNLPNASFCALNFNYSMWRCLICKKISKVIEAECFCAGESKCWTPLNCRVSGLIFSDQLDFQYHFKTDTLSNLMI